MKNIFNNKLLKYLSCFMIIMQGILLSLAATLYMDLSYFNKLNVHPSPSVYIQLKGIPEEKSSETFRFLKRYSKKNGLFYVRKDYLLDKNSGVSGVIFSVEGDLDKNKTKLDFEFLGQNVINYAKLKKLVDSKDSEVTLGIHGTSLNSLGIIPKFKFGKNIVFKKLETMVNETKTINGEYRIIGLTDSQKVEFLEGISKSSGIDTEVFFDGKSGYNLDNSLKETLVLGLYIIHSIVLLSLIVVITIKCLPNLGKLILQGWSRYNFAIKLYRPMIITAFVSILFFVLYGLFLTDITFKSLIFVSFMLAIGLFNFVTILIILSIASLFIFLVSPIDAIRERFPRKSYMIVTLIVYIVFNFLLIGVGSYVDGPYREVNNNIEILNKWNSVSEYKILRSVYIGNDQASFNRQSKEFFKDFYNWYTSISDQNGVSLVNTSYTSYDMLESYKANEVYKSVPNEPFWTFTVSPNYLKKIGVLVDKSVIEKAKLGMRIYLIPESKSKEEVKLLQEMFKESDTTSISDNDIKTVFNEKREFDFVRYNSKNKIFSWSAKLLDKLMVKNPIILISTPNNMIYRESESLSAIGLENSYIKFEGEVSKKYLSGEYLSKFNLNDNNVEFMSVKLFVDGLQKDLLVTIQWFFGALLSITIIIIILLITIVSIFQNSYKEKIAIKKFLGYSNFSIYKIPVSIVTFVVTFDIGALILLKSKIGIIYMCVIGILQLMIFYKVIINNQLKKLSVFLKS